MNWRLCQGVGSLLVGKSLDLRLDGTKVQKSWQAKEIITVCHQTLLYRPLSRPGRGNLRVVVYST